jgi:hypothetical protein
LQRPLNTYTPTVIEDLDADGTPDLLVSEGGDQFKTPKEARPAGSVLTVSGATGRVLAQLHLPAGEETYVPPVVVGDGGDRQVVIGTGGESHAGGLYLLPFDAVRRGHWEGVIELARSSGEFGWIGMAAVAQTGSETVVVANDMGGWVGAFGLDGEQRWSLQLRAGDQVPRFKAASAEKVVAPVREAEQAGLAVDGPSSYTGPVAADLDCDGTDEVLASRIRGSLTETVDRTYAVLDPTSGAIDAEFSTSGGGHAEPLVARPAGARCDQAFIYLGPEVQAATWDGTANAPRMLPALASASVTPLLTADGSAASANAAAASLVSVGCEGTKPAAPPPSGVVGTLPEELAVCRTALALAGADAVRLGGFSPSR